MRRLLSYNRPEWPFFVPAIVGALLDGAAMPVCTVALVGSMNAFFYTDKEPVFILFAPFSYRLSLLFNPFLRRFRLGFHGFS